MADARYLTPMDIELFYTGAVGHPFTLHAELLDIIKATGTLATSVTGVWNKLYGALVWAQLNQEANVFGMLPKTTWVRSGWRVKKGMATSDETAIAVTETATLPSAVYPDLELVSSPPKIQVETFEVSDVVEALASIAAEDVWGAAHQVRAEVGTEFIKLINKQLLHKVNELPSAWATELETLDRIVSKAGEVGFSSDWENVYGIDRSAAGNEWANAYVDDSSTVRSLTDALIRNLLTNVRARGGNPSVFLTGYDTYATLLGLYTTFVRYSPMGETKAQFGVGGIQTAAGLEAGIQIASLYGVPIVQSIDTPKWGTGAISEIFCLDISDPEGYGFPRLGLSVLRPVEYFETRDYVLLNKFVVKGVYRFVGQTIARNLYAQGKLRDIS